MYQSVSLSLKYFIYFYLFTYWQNDDSCRETESKKAGFFISFLDKDSL